MKPTTPAPKTTPKMAGDLPGLTTLVQQNHTLLLLNQAGQALTATLEIPELLEKLLQITVEIMSADGSTVWLWDEAEPHTLVCQAAYNASQTLPLLHQKLAPGQGIAGWVAQNGQSAIVPQAAADERFAPEIDLKTRFATQSLLVVPLRLRDTILGVLEVVNKHDGLFTTDDLTAAEILAASAAVALDNAQLVTTLRQQTADLQTRNAELDAFAHTVAHDLQNPLTLVGGFTEILLQDENVLSQEEREHVLQNVAKNVRRISNIVHELLLLSSIRNMEVIQRPLHMPTIVTSAVERLHHMVETSHARLIVPQEWPEALGYGPWVEEVWENYISNAIKYGGRPPLVELGATIEPDNMIRFWVRDNGRGLSTASQQELFVPFTKLSQIRAKGFGLGLSIVRRIVEKLGGTVAVESELGWGSTFSFTLPPAQNIE